MPHSADPAPRSNPIVLWWHELASRHKVRGAQHRLHQRAVQLACERVVSRTNPALRGLPGYRRRLLPVAERILAHGEALLGAIPGPTTLDPGAWAADPLVNALFADTTRLRQVVSGRAVQRWLRDHPGFNGDLYGLLLAMPQERQQLGIELIGDRVQRDVKQTTLSFSETEIVAVAPDMPGLRAALVQPLADLFVTIAKERIDAREARIQSLEEALAMLRAKQRALLSPKVGNARLARGGGSLDLGDQQRLEEGIEATTRDLADARRGLANIQDYLTSVIAELEHPERELQLQTMDLWIDRMNLIRDRRCEGARDIRLVRAHRPSRPGRVAQYVRFPRSLVEDIDERLANIQRQIGG